VLSYSSAQSLYTEQVSETSVAETSPEPVLSDRHLLGARLREARQRRGIGVRELSRRTNCSASLISQVELGKIAPSVSTLYSLTSVLGVSMDSLFLTDEERQSRPAASSGSAASPGPAFLPASASGSGSAAFPEPPAAPVPAPSRPSAENGIVQRRGSRPHISLEHGVRWERLIPAPEPGAEFLEISYDVGGGSVSGDNAIRHNGREYGLVLEGTLCVQVGFETYVLEAGDSVAFDSTVPHRFWNGGDVPVRAVWFELRYDGSAEVPGSRLAYPHPLH
jgi:transcriptional regulator with XRE-family HTH domain/quercetin dioxygenase-like cupin family protein